MGKIGLIKGYRNIEVGERQTLLIKKVKYDEKYLVCQVILADESGATLCEKFHFKGKKKGTYNEVALGMFSSMAKCATHDFSDREIDPCEIQGLYVVADVYEQESVNAETGETRVYLHTKNYREADVSPDEAAGDDDGLWD